MDFTQFLKSFFFHSSDGLLLLDAELSVLRANTVFCQLTGYEKEAVLGRRLASIFGVDQDDVDHSQICRTVKNGDIWQGEFHYVNGQGESRKLVTSILPAPLAGSGASTCLAICKSRALKNYADSQMGTANFDALTELPGSVIFIDRVRQALHISRREKQPVALLLVDLDRFARINDALGREHGDHVLQEIARRIKCSLRESDSAARITGDNFCLLIKVTADDHAALVAEKILKIISHPLTVSDRQVVITASIGIATAGNEGDTAALLMEHCESALHHAKNQGGNCFHFFADELNETAKKRLELEHNLRRGLENEEFVLFYQPKVDVNTQAIVGMEALIRWRHPVQGMVPPFQFIPVAEETGLIIDIGHWVLHEACRQNRQWQKEGVGKVPVAVNVSPRQFQVPTFADEVHKAINRSGLAPKYLELEITESMLMSNIDKTIDKLTALKDIGLTMAIDDFGTGYSNLSYLTRFPVSTLKIDRAFIKDVDHDANIAALTRSIINMSRSLSMKIVAEGAEVKEHIDFLKNHQCNTVQGYYYSKPLPADEFAALLKKGCIE